MQKVGKSELAAAIALYLLYADNEPSAEVYGAAPDRQQASIVFDVARQLVEMSLALMKRSKLMSATKRIVNYGNAGFYQVLSAEVGSKHGFSISGLVFDEIHSQPNRQLYDVLTKYSSDGRQNPLHFIITTAGNDRHSIAFELHTKAIDILEGRRVDPTFYPVVYGKKKLLWFADKSKSLNYEPKSDEMLITVHRWFANKSCPGNWLYARRGDLASKVTEKLGDENDGTTEPVQKKYYRVRKTWADAASQLGAYTVLENAKQMADKNPGYTVFDWNGKVEYQAGGSVGAGSGMTDAGCLFLVKVSVPES